MTIKITETATNVVEVARPGTLYAVALNHDEQRELLETLARIQGFSIVDREERKSLQGLVTEVDEDDNDYDLASEAWTTWQDRAEALAAAVTQALRFDIPGEV